MSEKKIETLPLLLEHYDVTIPMVQRDYAQGRENTHATYVRKTLLKDLKAALLKETGPLDLNFVYGKCNEDGKFVPLDGQQRLTTLFLLHVYAFRKNDSKTDMLSRFSYETRKSSLRFIRKLIENRATLFDDDQKKPSKKITDSSWFFYDWEQDPTIQSCLVMLDAIAQEFCDVADLEERLENSHQIVFQFLDIKDLGMDDSLYIKLNARGKPLSAFENFKARLFGRIKELKSELPVEVIEKFELCFDKAWTDLFWSLSRSDANNAKLAFDDIYLNFFGVLFFNLFVDPEQESWGNNWATTLNFKRINKEYVEAAYHTLNYLCEDASEPAAKKLVLDAILATEQQRSVVHRLLFHAVTKYIYLSENGIDNERMTKWLRVCRNLVLNCEIDRNEKYVPARRSLNSLVVHRDDIDAYLADSDNPVEYFSQQIQEERIKAALILKDPAFAEEIYAAEAHPYFDGKIIGALRLSLKDEVCDREQFRYYWERISGLFEGRTPKNGDLLRRALLTLGDYTLPVGEYKTLCVDDPGGASKTPSMKTLFSQAGEYVKDLLDQLDPVQDMMGQLEDIIDKGQKIMDRRDWKYCFVYHEKLMTGASGAFFFSTSHLRLRQVDFPAEETILVPRLQSNGYNYEIFILTLMLLLKENGIALCELCGDNGTEADRWLEVKGCQVVYRTDKFEISDAATGTKKYVTTTGDPLDEALKYLIAL